MKLKKRANEHFLKVEEELWEFRDGMLGNYWRGFGGCF
jgi:hypothetical protein